MPSMSKTTSSNRLLSAHVTAATIYLGPAHSSAENNRPGASDELPVPHPNAPPIKGTCPDPDLCEYASRPAGMRMSG
jgi:hypothetical protein